MTGKVLNAPHVAICMYNYTTKPPCKQMAIVLIFQKNELASCIKALYT